MNNQNKQNYWHELLSLCVLHLKQIPLILLYPIGASISIVHSLLAHVYVWALNLFDNAKSRKKKLTRLTRKAVRSVIGSLTNTFNATWSRTLCKLFTLLLQFISFLTTYAGFSFFIKHIHPLAPLFLAFVDQGGVFFLLNSYAVRKHDGIWKRNFLLVLLLFVSITTSFVGISNKIQDPLDDMKDSYNRYLSVHNNYLIDTANHVKRFSQDDIQAALNACVNVRSEAETTLQMISAAIPDKTTSDSTSWNSQTNPDGSRGYGESSESVINTELETKKEKLEASRIGLQEALANLRYDPSALRPAGIFRAVSSIAEDDPSPESYLKFLYCIEEHRDLAKEVSNARQVIYDDENEALLTDISILEPSLFSRKGLSNYNKTTELKDLAMLRDYEDVIGNSSAAVARVADLTPMWSVINAIFSHLDQFLMSPELTRAEQIRTLLNQEMRSKHSLLVSFGLKETQELTEQYEASLIPSTQLFPFRYLVRVASPNWGTSLLALLFAAMIDLLSVLIALTLVKRRDSILYAKNHREDTRNREEILEDCYTTLCLKSLQDSKRGLCKSPVTKTDIQQFVSSELSFIMTDFLKQVSFSYIPDSLDAFGYLTTSQIQGFSFENKNLFQTFRLIRLIRPVTKEELSFLLDAAFPSPTKETTTCFPDTYRNELPDEILYLVDNRLLMWYNENLSEFLSDNISSDDIISPMIEPDSLDI